MISETFIPFAQFTSWLGINPYDAYGIERESCPKCCCYQQYQYQSPEKYSREILTEALSTAEDIFVRLTNTYPNRYQILNEEHDFHKFINNDGNFASYRPNRPVGFRDYGKHSLLLVEEFVIDWTALGANDNEYPDTIEFSSAINNSNKLNENNFRIYYHEDELDDVEPEFNTHYGEVRPYKKIELIETDNGDDTYDYTVTITVDSYLLANPQFFEEKGCCVETYPTSNCYSSKFNLFVETKECCGYWITENANCTTDCTETSECACVYLRKVEDEYWFVPQLYNCLDDEKICLTRQPDRVRFNYITGVSANKRKYVNKETARVIFMLALGLLDVDFDPCQCDAVFRDKLKHFKDTDKYQIRSSGDNSEYDLVYEILKDDYDEELAYGLLRNRGVLVALSIMRKMRKDNIGIKRSI